VDHCMPNQCTNKNVCLECVGGYELQATFVDGIAVSQSCYQYSAFIWFWWALFSILMVIVFVLIMVFVIVVCFAESAIAITILGVGCLSCCFSCFKKEDSQPGMEIQEVPVGLDARIEVESSVEKGPPTYQPKQF